MIFKFDELQDCNLVVDAVYEGGSFGNVKDDPISKLLPVGNQGGFRYSGRIDSLNFLVLYTDSSDLDWPDTINLESGLFVYYGDNKEPGADKKEKAGNKILIKLFESLHAKDQRRQYIPPIFIFERYPTENSSRSVIFRGLCVPGHPAYSQSQDLVSIWKSKNGKRFENYKAIFSILNCDVIEREYLDALLDKDEASNAPISFTKFKDGERKYDLLLSDKTHQVRNKAQQLPTSNAHIKLLSVIFEFFKGKGKNGEFLFEKFAAEIFKMSNENILVDKITQNTVDGGRDAIGRLKIGPYNDPIFLHFSLEAKLYNPGLGDSKINSVGVKETSRLISRIRNREFGVLVTTSIVGEQALREIRLDKHPIIILSGKDIVDIIIAKGYNSVGDLEDLLESFET